MVCAVVYHFVESQFWLGAGVVSLFLKAQDVARMLVAENGTHRHPFEWEPLEWVAILNFVNQLGNMANLGGAEFSSTLEALFIDGDRVEKPYEQHMQIFWLGTLVVRIFEKHGFWEGLALLVTFDTDDLKKLMIEKRACEYGDGEQAEDTEEGNVKRGMTSMLNIVRGWRNLRVSARVDLSARGDLSATVGLSAKKVDLSASGVLPGEVMTAVSVESIEHEYQQRQEDRRSGDGGVDDQAEGAHEVVLPPHVAEGAAADASDAAPKTCNESAVDHGRHDEGQRLTLRALSGPLKEKKEENRTRKISQVVPLTPSLSILATRSWERTHRTS
jgi:hypothetical protein